MSPKQRKQVLLRLDPAVHDALARWAVDEFRSTNAHVEFLLRDALSRAGRLPGDAGPLPKRGRPPARGPVRPNDHAIDQPNDRTAELDDPSPTTTPSTTPAPSHLTEDEPT